MDLFHFYLFLAGIVGGFIAGVAGIGTGFILIAIIPIALHQLGIPDSEIVKLTIANTAFATMCSAFMNNIVSIKKGIFYKKESMWVAASAVVFSALLMQFAVLKTHYSTKSYNVIIIIFLLYVVIRSIMKLRGRLHVSESITKLKLLSAGAIGGGVAAFTGLGGGSVVMPLLNLWLKIDIKKAKSITYAMIFSVATVLTIVNGLNEPSFILRTPHMGYIIFTIAIPLGIGVVIASPLGVLASHRMKARTISYIFISLIILVIIRKSFELLN